MEISKYSCKDKVVAYCIMFLTLGLVVGPSIATPAKFQVGSLKDRVAKVTNILWAVIFFCFGSTIVIAMFDSFFVNRAVLIKHSTRLALLLLVAILITDAIVSVIPNSDKKSKDLK